MAGKRKKTGRKFRLFLSVLVLTITAGCAVLMAGWAVAGMETTQLEVVRVQGQMTAGESVLPVP